jgi:hypothetical protein
MPRIARPGGPFVSRNRFGHLLACGELQMASPPNDRLLIVLPSVSLGIATAAFIVAKTGRDALFFQGAGGLLQLPLVYINIAAASLPLALLFVKAMKIWGARRARVGVLVLASVVMIAGAPALRPGVNVPLLAMFMFIPAVFALVFASFWLLAADLFENADKRSAARAFSRMGAATLGGGIAGGGVAKGLAPLLDPNWLILLAGLLTGGLTFLIGGIHRRFPSNLTGNTAPNRVTTRLFAPLESKYVRSLVFIAMTGALAGLFIDFQFYAAAASANMGMAGNTAFFANFYILMNFCSLVLQLFATPWIQDRLGLRGGLMILPLALIGGATFVTAAATALSRAVLRVTEGGLRSSIHRSLWEQAFIPLASGERSTVKVAVDGVAARVAEALGATVLLVWLGYAAQDGSLPMPLDTGWITWVILAAVAAWLYVTHKLRTEVRQGVAEVNVAAALSDIDCERFPEQCPCTTELGKGIR